MFAISDEGTEQALDPDAQQRELFEFGQMMIDRCRASGISPVVYGSLAYLALTGDPTEGVHDIDFLVDEACFPVLLKMAAMDEDLDAEETTYHTIKVFRRGAKVSFDSISHYLSGLSWTAQPHRRDGIAFDAVDRNALVEVYRRGAATIPQNRDAYARKLAGLSAAPQ